MGVKVSMAGNMKYAVLLLALSGFSQGADFFTGMDRHIGCFYDQPNDRCLKILISIPFYSTRVALISTVYYKILGTWQLKPL